MIRSPLIASTSYDFKLDGNLDLDRNIDWYCQKFGCDIGKYSHQAWVCKPNALIGSLKVKEWPPAGAQQNERQSDQQN